MGMGDADFDDLLGDYQGNDPTPNFDMLDVEVVWVRGNAAYGSDHIAINNVTEEEVEEVLLEIPPEVEAKRHKDYPDRTCFWGATRGGRWLFVVCEDWREEGKRNLRPITAFEPEEGESLEATMTEKRMNDDELAEEARRWDAREITPAGWEDAPEAVPRAKDSMQINIRLPCQMVAILKEFAGRSGIGYQVLMKRWLDERIQQERHRFRQEQEQLRRERQRVQRPTVIQLVSPTFISQAAGFDGRLVKSVQ